MSHNFFYERLTDVIRVPPDYMNAVKRSSARTVPVWGSWFLVGWLRGMVTDHSEGDQLREDLKKVVGLGLCSLLTFVK